MLAGTGLRALGDSQRTDAVAGAVKRQQGALNALDTRGRGIEQRAVQRLNALTPQRTGALNQLITTFGQPRTTALGENIDAANTALSDARAGLLDPGFTAANSPQMLNALRMSDASLAPGQAYMANQMGTAAMQPYDAEALQRYAMLMQELGINAGDIGSQQGLQQAMLNLDYIRNQNQYQQDVSKAQQKGQVASGMGGLLQGLGGGLFGGF